MNKIVNFGSINIDHVYRVEHLVKPGETQMCLDYQRCSGGKGLNQSIALAHAGAEVYHAGKLNAADDWLIKLMREHGVDTRYVKTCGQPTGHAVIQVDGQGDNCIVIVGGANQAIEIDDIQTVLANFSACDALLVQNEVSHVAEILSMAHAQGLMTVFNPAPMHSAVLKYPFNCVDILVLNETEALSLTRQTTPEQTAEYLRFLYPNLQLLLTRGRQGAHYFSRDAHYNVPAKSVEAVDTTAAGDTFLGFFLAELMREQNPTRALQLATEAAAICVTRSGAAESIPLKTEMIAEI